MGATPRAVNAWRLHQTPGAIRDVRGHHDHHDHHLHDLYDRHRYHDCHRRAQGSTAPVVMSTCRHVEQHQGARTAWQHQGRHQPRNGGHQHPWYVTTWFLDTAGASRAQTHDAWHTTVTRCGVPARWLAATSQLMVTAQAVRHASNTTTQGPCRRRHAVPAKTLGHGVGAATGGAKERRKRRKMQDAVTSPEAPSTIPG